MLYREVIAVCSQIHTKHINTLCGQNVELLNVKPGGTYVYSSEGLIYNILKFSPYCAVNALYLGYNERSVNFV
jgi:hypothetical protein